MPAAGTEAGAKRPPPGRRGWTPIPPRTGGRRSSWSAGLAARRHGGLGLGRWAGWLSAERAQEGDRQDGAAEQRDTAEQVAGVEPGGEGIADHAADGRAGGLEAAGDTAGLGAHVGREG